jgi:ribulose-5-phosphate 4-epimerase/fuculose-1-phosphate aldolase
VSKYVKFSCERARAQITPFERFAELNTCRRKLLELQLIGVASTGISFGNLSVRDGATNKFYITGSATGGAPDLTPTDCARVVAYDFERNWLRYEGSAIPSSESLTHAAIYQSDAEAGAVIHCHDPTLWTAILNQAPTSSKGVRYGTPEMAYEIMRLFNVSNVQSRKILVMAGHEGGIVTFGKDLDEAFAVLTLERNESSPCVGRPSPKHTSAAS